MAISEFISHGLRAIITYRRKRIQIETSDELDHVRGTPTLLLNLLRVDPWVWLYERYAIIANSGTRNHWAINLLSLRMSRPSPPEAVHVSSRHKNR